MVSTGLISILLIFSRLSIVGISLNLILILEKYLTVIPLLSKHFENLIAHHWRGEGHCSHNVSTFYPQPTNYGYFTGTGHPFSPQLKPYIKQDIPFSLSKLLWFSFDSRSVRSFEPRALNISSYVSQLHIYEVACIPYINS